MLTLAWGGIKRLLNLFAVAVLLVPTGLFAADSSQQKVSSQKALPDDLMEWMSERYGAKTMLGLKWENPEKAKKQYVVENNAARAYALAYPLLANKPGPRRSAAKRMPPVGRLDIMPFAEETDVDTTVDSYLDIKYAGPGASWNIGYIKSSKTQEEWIYDFSFANNTLTVTDGTKFRKTEASVLFGSFVLTLPVESLSYYAFAGPAIVSYDYTEAGAYTTDTDLYIAPFTSTSTPGIYNTKKSGTAATWIVGLGMALRLTDSGFGFFGEYKYVPEAGDYPGLSTMGAGLSLGF